MQHSMHSSMYVCYGMAWQPQFRIQSHICKHSVPLSPQLIAVHRCALPQEVAREHDKALRQVRAKLQRTETELRAAKQQAAAATTRAAELEGINAQKDLQLDAAVQQVRRPAAGVLWLWQCSYLAAAVLLLPGMLGQLWFGNLWVQPLLPASAASCQHLQDALLLPCLPDEGMLPQVLLVEQVEESA